MSVPIQIKCWSCEELKEKNAALEAEAQALREQNTKFQHMLADVVAKHFAENIKRSTAQKSMDVYLSEGIRLLEEEIADLRARVVVPDEEESFERWAVIHNLDLTVPPSPGDYESTVTLMAWEAWKERSRLNGKAVSEGMLRSSREAIAEYADGIRSLARRVPSTDQRLAELDQCIADLSELLGEWKEVGDE